MSLTAADVEAQRFRVVFKGYDQAEVDEFLDVVSNRLTQFEQEREAIEQRLRTVEADAAESIEAERLLKRTLITAQRTADETVAEAVAQANASISEADQRATQIVAAAEGRAAEIIGEAERAAAETVAAARAAIESRQAAADEDLRNVRRAVAELQRFRSEYRERVRAAVAEQLAQLDSVGDIPDVPPDVARLAALPDLRRGGADAGTA